MLSQWQPPLSIEADKFFFPIRFQRLHQVLH
jgi:hypothetical protein